MKGFYNFTKIVFAIAILFGFHALAKAGPGDKGENGSASSSKPSENLSVSIFYRGKLYRQEVKYLEALRLQRKQQSTTDEQGHLLDKNAAERFGLEIGEQIQRFIHPDDLKGSNLQIPEDQQVSWVFTVAEFPEVKPPKFEVKSYGQLPETENFEKYPISIRKASLSSTGLAFDQQLPTLSAVASGEVVGMNFQYESAVVGVSDKLSFGYGEDHQLERLSAHVQQDDIPFFYPRVDIDGGVVCEFEPRSVTSKVTYEMKGNIVLKGSLYRKATTPKTASTPEQELTLENDNTIQKVFLSSQGEEGQEVTYSVTESVSTFYLAYQCKNPSGKVVLQKYWDEQDYPDPEIRL